MPPPKPILMNAFFDQLLTFLKELTAMYPEDADFPLASTTIRLMKSTTPVFVLNQFYESSKGFEDQILSKNEHFFLDHSFSEFNNDPTFDFNILGKLKQYVQAMSPASKDAVWVYVQNLYKLAQAYHS
jgi:hypothetical protein